MIRVLIDVEDAAGRRLLKKGDRQIEQYQEAKDEPLQTGTAPLNGRIVVAGLGPAGLFAARMLAQYGYRPLVVERASRSSGARRRLDDTGRQVCWTKIPT